MEGKGWRDRNRVRHLFHRIRATIHSNSLMSIEDRDIDGDGQYAAVVEAVPRGVRRQRDAANEDPMTLFFIVGVAGWFWQGQYRGHAVPQEHEDGQRHLFAL